MTVPHNKQLILNKISVVRLKDAYNNGTKGEIKEAERKFKNLQYEETEFLNIVSDEKKENGYIAEINVDGRGYKLTNQRWVRGSMLKIVNPFARTISNDEVIDRVVKPGLYLSTATGKLFLVLAPEDGKEQIETYLGYRFDEGELVIGETDINVDSHVMYGEVAMKRVEEDEGGSCPINDNLKLAVDKPAIHVGEKATLTATMLDDKKKPMSGKEIHLLHAGHAGELNKDTGTTDAAGKAVFELTGKSVGTTTVKAFSGVEYDSNRVAVEISVAIKAMIADLGTDKAEYEFGEDVTAKATIKDQDGNALKGVDVKFALGESVFNETTDKQGLASVTLQGLTDGSYELTATTADDTRKAAFVVKEEVKFKPERAVIATLTGPATIEEEKTFDVVGTVEDEVSGLHGVVDITITHGGVDYPDQTDEEGLFMVDGIKAKLGDSKVIAKLPNGKTKEMAIAVTEIPSFKAERAQVDTVVAPETIEEGQKFTVTGTLSDSETGLKGVADVTVNYNGVDTETQSNDKGEFSVADLTAVLGKTDITVKLGNGESKAAVITVTEKPTFKPERAIVKTVDVPESVEAEQTFNVSGSIADEVSGLTGTVDVYLKYAGKTLSTVSYGAGLYTFEDVVAVLGQSNVVVELKNGKNKTATIDVTSPAPSFNEERAVFTSLVVPKTAVEDQMFDVTGTIEDGETKLKGVADVIVKHGVEYPTKTDAEGKFQVSVKAVKGLGGVSARMPNGQTTDKGITISPKPVFDVNTLKFTKFTVTPTEGIAPIAVTVDVETADAKGLTGVSEVAFRCGTVQGSVNTDDKGVGQIKFTGDVDQDKVLVVLANGVRDEIAVNYTAKAGEQGFVNEPPVSFKVVTGEQCEPGFDCDEGPFIGQDDEAEPNGDVVL